MAEHSGSIPTGFKPTLFKKQPLVAPAPRPSLPSVVPPRSPRPLVRHVAESEKCTISQQCRIWLNEAQREIDRLRQSMATPLLPPPDARERGDQIDCMASPPKTRRLYAVAPVGEPPPAREATPPLDPGARVVARPHVTNVGSLLDVLA